MGEPALAQRRIFLATQKGLLTLHREEYTQMCPMESRRKVERELRGKEKWCGDMNSTQARLNFISLRLFLGNTRFFMGSASLILN